MDNAKDSKTETAPPVQCSELLGELWRHLKLLEMEETEIVRTALSPKQFDYHAGARDQIRAICHWMNGRGYSPNEKVSDAPH